MSILCPEDCVGCNFIIKGKWGRERLPLSRPENNITSFSVVTGRRVSDPVRSNSSLTQLCLSLQLYGLQHAILPCPSPNLGACSNSCPSSQWCHPTISSSVIPFSSGLQSFPESGSFTMSQFFLSGGQNIGVSASVLPMNIQGWFPLGWTG